MRQSLERVGCVRNLHGDEGEDGQGVSAYVFHRKSMPRSCFKDVVQSPCQSQWLLSFSPFHLPTGILPISTLPKHSILPKSHSLPVHSRPLPPPYPNFRNTVLKTTSSFATDSRNTLSIALLYTAKSPAYRNDLVFSPT